LGGGLPKANSKANFVMVTPNAVNGVGKGKSNADLAAQRNSYSELIEIVEH
jgi:hypothetical protein